MIIIDIFNDFDSNKTIIHAGFRLKYLPAVARRLHHCRDLGEPFDFLTWFEYAPADSEAFEELVDTLRETENGLTRNAKLTSGLSEPKHKSH